MLFGLDGVEIGLIITFLCLFGAIISGFPVAFALSGAAIIAFAIIAALDSAGILFYRPVDEASAAYRDLVASGVAPIDISRFSYPDLPRVTEALFPGGWELAVDRNISFIVNRINERVLAGASIETLLAVLMFVLMGIMLERSRIAEDLLTAMARVFGPLPGGLAVSVVVVGAFLAASTGIVGATVVTMGLLSLPTMLRNRYSPELATGVIAASGTLGQIIPPSIVIVLLGTLAGDIYATAQETRAQAFGCSDALTYLGEAAVVSVGTLFQAAILPGILLAAFYALYAFGYAILNPRKAPPVALEGSRSEITTRGERYTWFLVVPAAILLGTALFGALNLAGSQNLTVGSFSEFQEGAELRTRVSDGCRAAMIELHGQARWDRAVAQQAEIDASGGLQATRALSEDEIDAATAAKIAAAAPIGTGVMTFVVLFGLLFSVARGVAPMARSEPLVVGAGGLVLVLLADATLVPPTATPGTTALILALPTLLVLYGARYAVALLGRNELLRVVFPPLILIVAVLGSILGGITNPTPAAALGAGGAILLAAHRRLRDSGGSGRIVPLTALAVTVMVLVGFNFDLRMARDDVRVEEIVAYAVAQACYLFAIFGLLYSCWVLWGARVLGPVVRETAKVTSMVFTILIGSQLLNLVVISFGGEAYVQDFLRSFEREWVVFLLVMLVLFVMGFVLDFLEIIYIVVPIVGPVIYGGTLDPSWVTIMIAVNLQTSFLTPPFGFALFYLRGVAPPSVTTGQIYRGITPFVLIQVGALLFLWLFPWVVTIVPDLMSN